MISRRAFTSALFALPFLSFFKGFRPVQEITFTSTTTLTGGTYVLGYAGRVTRPIPWNANQDEIEAAVNEAITVTWPAT